MIIALIPKKDALTNDVPFSRNEQLDTYIKTITNFIFQK